MTATTFTHLPLAAGSAVASYLGRAGSWALARYMRAPLSSTGLLAMVTLTALAASNALYFQTARHPAPFFSPTIAVADAPIPMDPPAQLQVMTVPSPVAMPQQSTGSVSPVMQQAIPEAPVGNKQAFEVQKKLHELGLFNGKVDGFYGPMTATAIRTFEHRNGMTPTGALTPSVVDAILKADASGLVQRAAVVAPPPVVVPAPVVQQAVQPVQVVPQPVIQQAAAQIPPLSPIDRTVDTVGSAAAQSIDAIVAVVDGARGNSVASAVAPVPTMPLTPPVQAMPAPVQVASLEAMAPPAQVPAQAEVAPANNTQLVGQIQRGLASLGFYHGSIDGHPGDATARAIREFENFHSYRVTGQVNPDLVGLLRDSGASI